MHLQGPPFNDLLTTAATWALVGCGCWAALVVAAAVLESATGGRLRATAWVGCPPALRRSLLALLGVALAAGPGPASASPGDSAPGSRRAAPPQALPVPARPVGAMGKGPQIVVRPGDTLWHLAAARLPTTASQAEVCALVERLYAGNRGVIGPDPDLIRPGQRLVVPHPTPS